MPHIGSRDEYLFNFDKKMNYLHQSSFPIEITLSEEEYRHQY